MPDKVKRPVIRPKSATRPNFKKFRAKSGAMDKETNVGKPLNKAGRGK